MNSRFNNIQMLKDNRERTASMALIKKENEGMERVFNAELPRSMADEMLHRVGINGIEYKEVVEAAYGKIN